MALLFLQVDSTDLFPRCDFGKMFSGDEKLAGVVCGGGGKGRISFIMASEQHLGQMRVTEVPLAGGQSH